MAPPQLKSMQALRRSTRNRYATSQSISLNVHNEDKSLKAGLTARQCSIYSLNVGFVFCAMYGGYFGTLDLENSVNGELGSMTGMVLMISYTFWTLFISTIVRKFGPKCCMLLATTGFGLFEFVHMFPHPVLLPLMAMVIGFNAAVIGTAAGSYVNALGYEYARATGEAPRVTISFLQGVFFSWYCFGHVWANIASSLVFGAFADDDNTAIVTEKLVCGAGYCPNVAANRSRMESQSSQVAMSYLQMIYMTCALFGSLVVVFGMKELWELGPNIAADMEGVGSASWGEMAKDGFKMLLVNNKIKFLFPLFLSHGYSMNFAASEFTTSFIGCALGTQYIGYIMILYGVSAAGFSLILGRGVKWVRRSTQIVLIYAMCIALCSYMLVWDPHDPSQSFLFVVYPIVLGLIETLMDVHVNTIIGLFFPRDQEAAFGVFYFWKTSGGVMIWGMASVTCSGVKIALFVLILVLAEIGYIWVELKHGELNQTRWNIFGCSGDYIDEEKAPLVGTTDSV